MWNSPLTSDSAPALPPLVAPGPPLSSAELSRYSRHLLIPDFGVSGQRRLKNARVLVIGAGGLGSPALLYLAAAGVGTLGVVDFDVVDESNLQRQIIHHTADVGRPKTESAAESIAAVNPLVDVRTHPFRLTPDNAVELFGDYDVIIDGSDNFATRYLVNDAAVLAAKPYVWGSLYRFEGQASVFWEQAPDGRGLNYRDLYPDAPPAELAPSCAEAGVLGIVCASIASVMGTEAIKLITGIGESLLGRLLIYDALAMTYRTIRLVKDPAAPVISSIAESAQQGCVTVGADAVISATELCALLASGTPLTLVDVREPFEWEAGHIDGAQLIPLSSFTAGSGLAGVATDRKLVLYCKTGGRSARALAAARAAGRTDVVHLDGGISAWARQVAPEIAVY